MSAQPDLVTVYRSMDSDAEEDCKAIRARLVAEGIPAQLVDDSAPGVPEGVYEVLVPTIQSHRAEQLIEQYSQEQTQPLDRSADLNLETVFHAEGESAAEFAALSVKNLLESNGITAVLVGDSVFPNLPFEVRVARDQAKLARELIAEAEQAESKE